MRSTPLTKGKFAIVDDKDYEYLCQWKWWYGAKGYAVTRITGVFTLMHRLINATPEGLETDHINGDRLDNRRMNLRNATSQQNKFNKPVQSNNGCGVKGVQYRSSTDTWTAQIHVGGRKYYLGVYPTKELAAEAYSKAASELHGEFARV